jgi:hypothetical protein
LKDKRTSEKLWREKVSSGQKSICGKNIKADNKDIREEGERHVSKGNCCTEQQEIKELNRKLC